MKGGKRETQDQAQAIGDEAERRKTEGTSLSLFFMNHFPLHVLISKNFLLKIKVF
jgi:hypothetical protein